MLLDGQVATYLHKTGHRPAAAGRRARGVHRGRRRDGARDAPCRSPRCVRSTSPVTRSRPTPWRTSAAIAEATAREEGKPEAALPKIVEGRVNGYFKDVVLTEQSSVLDSKKASGRARRGRDRRPAFRALRGRPVLNSGVPGPGTGIVRHRPRPWAAWQTAGVTDSSGTTVESDAPAGYDRVLLKLSGEAFAGGHGIGVDPDTVHTIARQIAEIVRAGTQVAWSSVAATTSGAPSCPSGAWTGPAPTTWACSAPS